MRFCFRSLRWLLPLFLILSVATQAAARSTEQTTAADIATLTKQAESGNVTAQYLLGYGYAHGDGIAKDEVEAIHWYRKAAEQGNASAQFSLGGAYDLGEGVPQSYTEAVWWYRKAAEQGEAAAQYSLAQHYVYGRGVPEDAVEGVRWCRKAAEQRYAMAQFFLGMLYSDGKRVPKDEAEAYFWLNLYEALPQKRNKVGGKLTLEKRLEVQERCRKWAEAQPQINE